MTVRVNKPAFNIREKLSELERPIGVKGHELMGAETAQDARDFISAGRKNLIINGDLRIWQRSTSATINTSTSTNHKTADRWNHWHQTGGAVTESRSTDVPPGAGFYYSLKHEVTTADTAIASGEYHCHKYDIEGYDVSHLMWGTAQAKPITVSFWAKSSVVGDYGLCIRPGANNTRFYVDTITISQKNTWKKYSFTIPGCLDGTWEKTTSAGLLVQISHSMGTTYQTASLRQWISGVYVSPTTQVNWMQAVGNTWYITGLQVEEGTVATEFEHRPYGEELALCHRYYWQTKNTTGNRRYLGIVQAYNTTSTYGILTYVPVEMRANATVGVTGSFGFYNASSGTSSTTTPGNLGFSPGRIETANWTGGSGLTAGQGLVSFWDNNALIYASAEL